MGSLSAADFRYVRDLVARRSGIALEDGKEYLVSSRLLPLTTDNPSAGVAGLVRRLRAAPENGLHTAVVEAMTTNETSWFRDRALYDALDGQVLPALLQARQHERRLRVWSAAAASGQEAYSVGMLLHERLAGDPAWTVRVLATDLSAAMVERIRAGRYSQLEVNRGLPAGRLVRHLTRTGSDWQVSAALRAMVEARQLNLAAPFPPMPRVDLVLLRNVLIYFALPTRRHVLAQVRRVLRPDGYLVLGSSETTYQVDDAFERVAHGGAMVFRLRTAQAAA